MYQSNTSLTSSELELDFILDRIQCGADAVKEEVQQDVEGYWEAVKVHNKEHRQRQ